MYFRFIFILIVSIFLSNSAIANNANRGACPENSSNFLESSSDDDASLKFLLKEFIRAHNEEIKSLKEQISLKEEIRILKEEMVSLKEEMRNLKEELSKNTKEPPQSEPEPPSNHEEAAIVIPPPSPIPSPTPCEEAPEIDRPYFNNTIYLGYRAGNGIGYKGSYSTVGIFSILDLQKDENTIIPFLDFRVHFFNKRGSAANLGIGGRYLYTPKMAFGCNLYYDYRWAHHRPFHQMGVGFEILTPCWDLRLNTYIPFRNHQLIKSHLFDHYEGSFFAICNQFASLRNGIDLEVGTWLKKNCSCNDFGIYLTGGPYYYSKIRSPCKMKGLWGGKAALQLYYGSYLRGEVGISYDHCSQRRAYAKIEVNFDFGCGCRSEWFVSQPVRRQEIIPLTQQQTWEWNW